MSCREPVRPGLASSEIPPGRVHSQSPFSPLNFRSASLFPAAAPKPGSCLISFLLACSTRPPGTYRPACRSSLTDFPSLPVRQPIHHLPCGSTFRVRFRPSGSPIPSTSWNQLEYASKPDCRQTKTKGPRHFSNSFNHTFINSLCAPSRGRLVDKTAAGLSVFKATAGSGESSPRPSRPKSTRPAPRRATRGWPSRDSPPARWPNPSGRAPSPEEFSRGPE
jgi:hypothetical protein